MFLFINLITKLNIDKMFAKKCKTLTNTNFGKMIWHRVLKIKIK